MAGRENVATLVREGGRETRMGLRRSLPAFSYRPTTLEATHATPLEGTPFVIVHHLHTPL